MYDHKLPEELIPEDDLCVCVQIPNHPDYVALFVRAVRLLELDRHYERDEDHNAIIVRNQWSTRTITPLIEGLATGSNMCCCEEILEMLENLSNQVAYLYNNEMFGESTVTIDQTLPTIVGQPELDVPIGNATTSTGTCTTNAEKDEVWGGCLALVDYILQRNEDWLEEMEQYLGNIPENLSNIVEAIPLLGELPFDDLVEYGAWLVEELLEEYRAQNTEAIRIEMACQLFCAALLNNCAISFDLLFTFFLNQLPQGVDIATITIRNAVSFALAGNFIGDDYVYFLSMFQIFVARAGELYFGQRGWRLYEIYYLSGYNSPDSDWQLFCECATSWTWQYSATQCDLHLPAGWDIEFVTGDCGDGPGTLDGLKNYGGTNPADLQFKIIPPPGVTVANISFEAARNITGGTGSMTVTQGTFTYNPGLAPDWNTYQFSPNEEGEIVWTLHEQDSGFNGVAVRKITIDW